MTGAFIVLSIKFESTTALKASTLFVAGDTIGAAWFALLSKISVIRALGAFSAAAFVYLTTTATLLVVVQEESFVTSVASSLAFALEAEGATILTSSVIHEFSGTTLALPGCSADFGSFWALTLAFPISHK